MGVTLFFILSGASLYYNYSDKFNCIDFYKKRILKIYIPFYVTYVLALWLLLVVNKGYNFIANRSAFLLTLLGVDGYIGNLYGVKTFYLVGEWFLGCIIILYLFFPLLQFLVNRYAHVTLCALIAFQIAICIFANDWVGAGGRALTRILEFYYGMYFMKVIREKQRVPVPEILVIAVIFFIPVKIPLLLRIVLTGVCTFHTLFYAGNWKGMKCLSGVCAFITKHSYVIFLSHHILIKLLCQYFKDSQFRHIELLNLFLLTIAVVLGASILIDRVVLKILLLVKGFSSQEEHSLTCK